MLIVTIERIKILILAVDTAYFLIPNLFIKDRENERALLKICLLRPIREYDDLIN